MSNYFAVDQPVTIKCDFIERIINPAQLPHHEFFVSTLNYIIKTAYSLALMILYQIALVYNKVCVASSYVCFLYLKSLEYRQ